MTSQATQIQTLINEIDAALNKTSTRLPWVMSGEAMQQRRVLEQTRQYLVNLQEQAAVESTAVQAAPTPAPSAAEESAQHVLQAVLQEMGYLRSHILQPLRADIDRLHQEREALNAEIKQLQEQRQQALPPQSGQQQIIEDFMRSLMNRVQEQLAVQVTQTVANLSASPAELPGASLGALPGGSDLTNLTPEQRVAQVQRLQAQSDQLLLKLDSTLRVIFESLQTNMQGYQESLGQGLEKMHSLGQQGEAMFAALVNRLAQQLGREASSYLQSSFQSGEWKSVATSQLLDASSLQPLNPPANAAPASPELDEVTDSQIDQLLEELKAGGVSLDDALESPAPAPVVQSPTPTPAPDAPPTPEVAPSQGAIAPVSEDEEPLPLEPIAEWDGSEENGLAWSPDLDLETLDAAFDIIGDVAALDSTDGAEDVQATDEPEDEFYQSLFGAEFAETEDLDADLTDAPMAIADPTPVSLDGFTDEFDLFGGLADPAEDSFPATAEDMPRRDETLSELSTQALEGVLFPDSEPLFTEERLAGSLPSPIPDGDLGDQGLLDEPSDEDEAFVLASPEEDLLSDDIPEQVVTVDLNLDDGTLTQLTADLQALESSDQPYSLAEFGEAIAPNDRLQEAPQADTDTSAPPPLPSSIEDFTGTELRLIGLDTTPSEPTPQVINDGTLTQPTLDSFFAGVTEEAQEPQSAAFQVDAAPISFTPKEPPPSPTALIEDLNLIWEAFDTPESNPSVLSQPEPDATEEPEWTLNDAFGDLDNPAPPSQEAIALAQAQSAEPEETGWTLSDAFGDPDNSTPPSPEPATPVPPQPEPEETGWTLSDAFGDLDDSSTPSSEPATPASPQPEPIESNDRGWTLADAFGELEEAAPSQPAAVQSEAPMGEKDQSLTLDGFGSALDGEGDRTSVPNADLNFEAADELGLTLSDFGATLDESGVETDASMPSSREPEVTLGQYFEALDGLEETAPEPSSLESILEEQDIFTLDNLTLENLFEDLPDGQPAGVSKKK